MQPLNFTDPIHTVHGASAGGTVYQFAKNPRPDLIVLKDNLLFGPSDADPVRHSHGRLAFWQSEYKYYSMDQSRLDIVSFDGFAAALAAFPGDRPIVIWSAPSSLSDLVTLWWTFDTIGQLGLNRNRIWLGQPFLDFEGSEESFCGTGSCPVSAFLRGFERLKKLSAGILRAGSRLWQSFADRSPVKFEKACLKGQEFFPSIVKQLKYYARLFPSSSGGRHTRLQLSFLDQFILDGLSTSDWKRSIDVLQADKDRFFALTAFLNGDLWLPRRLLDWCEHDKDQPLVLLRKERRGVSQFNWGSYRLTKRGQSVRDTGMTCVGDAPLLHIGGCKIHDPGHPWLSVVSRAGAHRCFQELDV